ncbi:MAG: cyclomaltodextrinase N-terminal domain-containing protein [Chitinophagaceae bacterium]|nr:cyclomaltodextrinase N-terminal domain-containing protein [Chitinophagaceae bacterium]
MLKLISLKKVFLLLIVTQFAHSLNAQIKVYPTHWWVGMKNPNLQILLHENKIGFSKLSLKPYQGVTLKSYSSPENKNYVFIDLVISASAKPGNLVFTLKNEGVSSEIKYSLKQRNIENGKTRVKGVTSADLIYLIMPDRFSNGDTTNDIVNGLREKLLDRKNPYSRHGGDLKGVESKLDYLNDLGVTTIWMTPVVENDMPLMNEWAGLVAGYHGYWFTDHYAIDPRFGGNQAYKALIESAHRKGLKIIQDAVYNHVGNHHWSVLDLPMNDWLNQWPSYTNTNHKEEVFYDPHGVAADKNVMIGGWFVPHLPDLNLKNPYCANYMIQQAVWTTEEFGIDGWRVDTYKYCDEPFLNKINTILKTEFPSISIFGEAWCSSPVASAYFTQNNLNVPFKHNLPGVTDFPMTFSMLDAAKKGDINNLYSTLAQDFLYKNPLQNCIFLDNHDMDRIYSVMGENLDKYKIAMGLLLTQRGIPQMYYGDEVLMKNFKNPSDAAVREDFLGGWKEDLINKFTATGRNQKENEAFNYVKTIANFRKTSKALQNGKLIQYLPQNDLYVYFRTEGNQIVMCIVNISNKAATIDLNRFTESFSGKKNALDVISGKKITLDKPLNIDQLSILILDLK